MPKFNSKASLIIGVVAGILLSIMGWTVFNEGRWVVGSFQVVIGLILSVHCLDMIRFWKTHNIVEVNNKETKRVA